MARRPARAPRPGSPPIAGAQLLGERLERLDRCRAAAAPAHVRNRGRVRGLVRQRRRQVRRIRRYGQHQPDRSEEHTSELQSQSNLVCRLLLEKKKQPDRRATRGSAVPTVLLRKKSTHLLTI